MLADLIAVAVFLVLMGGITLFGYRAYVRPGTALDQISGPPASVRSDMLAEDPQDSDLPGVRVFQLIGEQVPVSPQDTVMSRRYLMGAGYRSDRALAAFYGVKVVCCLIFLLIALPVFMRVSDVRALQFVFLAAMIAAGFFAPNFALERLVSRRQERLRMSLPDALDLMVVSVEAGLGLDQAIQTVARELATSHKDLSEELNLVTLEIRAGKRRGDALKNLVDRTGEADLRKLVAVLAQTDKFGTSMADSLRSHSDFMRARRTQEAEERANKVGVKLVFPIFFFVLPSMLIIAAGPAMIQVFRGLIPALESISST